MLLPVDIKLSCIEEEKSDNQGDYQTVDEKISELVHDQISSWDKLLESETRKAIHASASGIFFCKEKRLRKSLLQSIRNGSLTRFGYFKWIERVTKRPELYFNQKTGNPLFLDAYLVDQPKYNSYSTKFIRTMLWTCPKSRPYLAQIKNKAGLSGWMAAILRGNQTILMGFPQKILQNERGPLRSTPLMVAAGKGRLQILKFLLTQVDDTDQCNQLGLTALDFAKHGQGSDAVKCEMIRLLKLFQSNSFKVDAVCERAEVYESVVESSRLWRNIYEKDMRDFRLLNLAR